MKISYTMSVDDHIAFNLYYMTHCPSHRRDRVIWGILLPLALFVFFAVLNFRKDGWSSIFCAAIVTGLIMLWYLGGYQGRIKKNTRKLLREGENKLDLGKQELEVTSEGLSDKNEFGEGRLNWTAIENTVSLPDYYFIFVGAAKAIVLPKRKITDGDFEEFRRLVEEGFRNAAMAGGIDARTFDESKLMVDDKPVYRGDPGRKSCLCGVMSLAGGVLAAAFYGLVIGMVIVAGVSQQGEEAVEAPPSGAYLIMAAIAANLLGMVCGISGLIKANQKKLLPIIGLVINGGILLVIALLVMIAIIFGR